MSIGEIAPQEFIEVMTPSLLEVARLAAGRPVVEALRKQHEPELSGAAVEPDRASRVDVVSEVDLQAQELLLEAVYDRWPFVSVLAEEDTRLIHQFPPAARFCVLVDPLDGTQNFLSGDNHYCHIVSLMDGPEMVASLVYSHATDRLFSAVRGGGTGVATSDRQDPIRLPRACATVFFHHVSRVPDDVVDGIRALGLDATVSRQNASDILTILSGAATGFVSLAPLVYDVWSPGMLVQEAGGWLSDWCGRPVRFDGQGRLPHVLIASSSRVASSLVSMMSRCQNVAVRSDLDSTSGA